MSAQAAVAAPAPTVEKIAADLVPLMVPLASVRQHPRNPNEGDAAGIAGSLDEFSQYKPIVVQASTRYIVAGNHTWAAAARLGWRFIAAVVLELTDAEALAILVGDNRHSERAERDPELLVALLAELRDADRLAGTGYSGADLDDLLAELAGPVDAPLEEPDPDPPAERARAPRVTRYGDLWALGQHRLLCGDAASADDAQRLLGDRRAAVCVTSPPYADRRAYDARSEFRPVPPEGYVAWFDPIAANIQRHLAPDGGFFLNIKPHTEDGQRVLYVADLILHLVRARDWRLVDELCWHNTREGIPGGYKDRFKNAWEPLYHLARQQGIKFRPQQVLIASESAFVYEQQSKSATGSGIGLGTHRIDGTGFARPSNVLTFAAEGGQGEHTAPFPAALPDFVIRGYSDPGDVVYDPFGGSGTTLLACEEAVGPDGAPAPRQARLLEISPAYCDVILRRYAVATGQDPVRHDGARYSDLVEAGLLSAGMPAVLDENAPDDQDDRDDPVLVAFLRESQP